VLWAYYTEILFHPAAKRENAPPEGCLEKYQTVLIQW